VAVRLTGVTFECADARPVSAFWAQVLGMSTWIADGADHVVIGNDRAGLTLGFTRVEDYRPPTWPGSPYPQQVHLDIPVYEGAIAAALMQDLGAVRLPSRGGCPVYADPAGHPFCLCTNQQNDDWEWPALPGLIGNVVLDCPRPQLLASFYSTLLNFRHRMDDAKGWVVIVPRPGYRPRLAFQGSSGDPPGWNDREHPQQAGLDLVSDDLENTTRQLARLGVRRLDDTSEKGVLYLDPAGHVLTIS
jgi:hypothetical protein